MKKQSAIDWPTVMKLFAGGALAGAGLGAGTTFMRHLQALRDESTAETTAGDDNVLYLHLPKAQEAPGAPKMASAANTTGTFVAGGVSGVLGTILAYNAVRNIYNEQRKKQMQKELDSSQNIYLGNLGTQAQLQKNASQFGLVTSGMGTAGLVLTLAALGSGIAANRLLNKQFPPVTSPNRMRPRKIVIERDGGNPENANPDDEQVINEQVTPDALENVARTSMNMPKVANADCSLADLVGAVAAGRGQEIKDNILNLGVAGALDLIKGARLEKVGSFRRNLAYTWIANDPVVSTAMAPIIASEFQEGGGEWFMKAAREIPQKYHDHLVGIAEAGTQECRAAIYKNFRELPAVKQAMVKAGEHEGALTHMMMAGGLGAILGTHAQHGGGGAASNPDQPGDTNTPVSQDSELPDVELNDDAAKKFWQQNGPMIDNSIKKV